MQNGSALSKQNGVGAARNETGGSHTKTSRKMSASAEAAYTPIYL